MSDDLGHLDFDIDVDGVRSDAGVALAIARTVHDRLMAGDLPALEKIGKWFTIASPGWTPSFGPAPAWDPSRDDVGVVVGPDGRPVCLVTSDVITRP